MKLNLTGIQDPVVRENFTRIQSFLDNYHLDKFVHIDLIFKKAETNFRYRHNLGFRPLDVFHTMITGGPTILTWNHALWDDQFIDITTDGPCRVRAFIGTFQNSEPRPDE